MIEFKLTMENEKVVRDAKFSYYENPSLEKTKILFCSVIMTKKLITDNDNCQMD